MADLDFTGATPPLDEFLTEYNQDDNIWWVIGCGHHQNLFEDAADRMQRSEAERDRRHEEAVRYLTERNLERARAERAETDAAAQSTSARIARVRAERTEQAIAAVRELCDRRYGDADASDFLIDDIRRILDAVPTAHRECNSAACAQINEWYVQAEQKLDAVIAEFQSWEFHRRPLGADYANRVRRALDAAPTAGQPDDGETGRRA